VTLAEIRSRSGSESGAGPGQWPAGGWLLERTWRRAGGSSGVAGQLLGCGGQGRAGTEDQVGPALGEAGTASPWWRCGAQC
jgi:hypothetical protein